MEDRKNASVFVRNIVFGAVDSLVSTVGLLAGIAVSPVASKALVFTGVVYVFVEGFSMAVGSFLAEDSAAEYEARAAVSDRSTIGSGITMFVSFVLIGFVPILPYMLLSGIPAVIASIIISLLALAIVGYVQARISGLPSGARILRIVLLGGFAIAIGIGVGKLFGVS